MVTDLKFDFTTFKSRVSLFSGLTNSEFRQKTCFLEYTAGLFQQIVLAQFCHMVTCVAGVKWLKINIILHSLIVKVRIDDMSTSVKTCKRACLMPLNKGNQTHSQALWFGSFYDFPLWLKSRVIVFVFYWTLPTPDSSSKDVTICLCDTKCHLKALFGGTWHFPCSASVSSRCHCY